MAKADGKAIIPNKLGDKILEILSPKVGAIVAQAMLEKQCTIAGISPTAIRNDHIEVLAQRIEHVLVIFGHDGKEAGARIRALKDKIL